MCFPSLNLFDAVSASQPVGGVEATFSQLRLRRTRRLRVFVSSRCVPQDCPDCTERIRGSSGVDRGGSQTHATSYRCAKVQPCNWRDLRLRVLQRAEEALGARYRALIQDIETTHARYRVLGESEIREVEDDPAKQFPTR
jgi:hypothetical protein